MVEELLARRWSPQQISGRLRLDSPDDPTMWISHETIYLALFDPRRRAINRQLSRQLRTGRLMRLPRKARQPSGRIRDMLPIGERPAEADDRKTGGHWEGDLVMGTRPSAIATLVERTSRRVCLVALPDGIKAHQVRSHLSRAALRIEPHLRRTLTWDRGREMAEHARFTGRRPADRSHPRTSAHRPGRC